ncbi:MAG: four helix bundle protein [Candidatus Gastranaerophilales bacterium]|nr:four helix bundle protein [Candidatus Gastranaerophilales bacterium]
MNHKDLEVWKLAMEFITDIYSITKKFPKEEFYGLTNQIRRCAISIPSNIAEGSARQSDKELIQFLYIALGSVSELETQLIIARNLNYINEIENYIKQLISIRSLTLGLIKYIKNKNKSLHPSPFTLH